MKQVPDTVAGGHVIDVACVGGALWSIAGETVAVPEGESVSGFVLREIFSRVGGVGPWVVDVHPEAEAGISLRLVLGVDGSVVIDESLGDPEPVTRVKRNRVLGALIVVAVLGGAAVLGVSVLSGKKPDSPGVAGPLWSVPGSVVPVGAAGAVAAGVDGRSLALFSGSNGERISLPGAPAVVDTSLVRAGAGDGVAVFDVGGGAGVTVQGGMAVAYAGKGSLLTRGPVPALVDASGEARKFFVFRAGKPVDVVPPATGNSLFGGLPGGGSVWAVAGGKVTYVPAAGAARTVSLSVPAAGASVASWVSVNEQRTVVIWKTGASRVLAVHATKPGTAGEIVFQRELADDDVVAGDAAHVWIGRGTAGSGNPARITSFIDLGQDEIQAVAPVCQEPVVAGQTLWCPDGGTWSGKDFTVPGKPIAAGDGFVLVTEERGPVAVPGPKP